MTSNSFVRSLRSFGEVFLPPFDGLWLVATLYFAWSYLVFPHSPVMHGDLPDTDDYMYLVQILDWLHGQGWYDNVQHRLNPPDGVPIHFSRLAMLPMAAMIKFIEFLGLGPKGSATIMAMVYPVMLLAWLFGVLRWCAQSIMAKEWVGATAFVGVFAVQTTYMFQPGHVDHHNIIIVLVMLALGSAFRMMQNPEQHRWPLYIGLLMAVGMTIALEILPWILLLSAFIGFWGVMRGGTTLRAGLLYSMVFLVGSALCLLITRPPSDLFNLDVLTYSVVYVILAAGIAVTFAGAFLATRAPLLMRAIVALLVAVISGYAFFHHFPEMVAGPYGGIDPALARIILDEISEAQPLKEPATQWLSVFWMIGSFTIAVPAGIYFWVKSSGVQRWLWSLLMVLLLASLALSLFYQRRFIATANALEILPMTMLLQQGWSWIGANWRGRKQFFAEVMLILITGPLLVVLVPAMADGRSFNTGVFLYSVTFGVEESACETYDLENALRNPLGIGSRQRMIMNPMGLGPELLFRTQHKVLAAPFHMDVEGNVDATRFFSTPYPEEAEAIARRRHIDLVVTCALVESYYFHKKPWDKTDDVSGPGQDFAPHFIERLVQGHIPAWLKPMKVPGLKNYFIYEVLPPVDDKPKTTPKK